MWVRALLVAAIGVLAGCASVPDQSTSRTEERGGHVVSGAVTGSLAGALIGRLTSNKPSKKRILTGATLGGLLGAAVGHHADSRNNALLRQLRQSGFEVIQEKNGLWLSLLASDAFEYNSTRVSRRGSASLDSIVQYLQDTGHYVRVIAHTNASRNPLFDERLSVAEARAVSDYLANDVGQSRIAAYARGSEEPVASELTSRGQRLNHRIEFHIVPRKEALALAQQ